MTFDELFSQIQARGDVSWLSLYLYFGEEGVKVEMDMGDEKAIEVVDKYDRIFQKPIPLDDIPELIAGKLDVNR